MEHSGFGSGPAGRALSLFAALLLISVVFCLLLTPTGAQGRPAASSAQATGANLGAALASVQDSGRVVYGKSGLGGDLACVVIAPPAPVKTRVLMTFEIHGYEDLQPADGQALVEMGNALAAYFSQNRAKLRSSELIVVPSANPDGLAHGSTSNGPGRCQVSSGIDINRDFPFDFITYDDARNRTLAVPFSAPESRALRDLFEAVRPDVVIDCHGWEDDLIGDEWLRNICSGSLGISRYNPFSVKNHGYYSYWAASRKLHSMLLEYPPAAYTERQAYAARTCAALEAVCARLAG